MDSLNMIHLISMEEIINCQTNIKKAGHISLELPKVFIEFFMIKVEFPIRIIQRY